MTFVGDPDTSLRGVLEGVKYMEPLPRSRLSCLATLEDLSLDLGPLGSSCIDVFSLIL